jgi:recombinational DNA repair protein (RecF pathway)
LTLSKTKQRSYLEKATLIQFAPLSDEAGILGSLMMQTALQIALLSDDQAEGALLYEALVTFRKGITNPVYQWLVFLMTYLSLQGVPMSLQSCVHCQKTTSIIGLSTHLGGFICQDCLPKTDATTLPAKQLKALLDLNRQPEAIAHETATLSKLIPYVHRHFTHHVDVPMQGFSLIEMVLEKIHS